MYNLDAIVLTHMRAYTHASLLADSDSKFKEPEKSLVSIRVHFYPSNVHMHTIYVQGVQKRH